MKTVIELLRANAGVSDYKINITKKSSYELFFVKGRLETVRHTDTCDRLVTVYADHDGFKGDSQFYVYPSTTPEMTAELIDDAVTKARLINNEYFTLPGGETGEYAVESNFAGHAPEELAALIANTVFEANTVENGSLNSVEIFVNKYEETVINSRGLEKTQTKYDAMVEAIPTYNGEKQSVELYEMHVFSQFDEAELRAEISRKMDEVKARYEAAKPEKALDCPVILCTEELSQLMRNIAYDLNYSAVYSHSNLHKKGDDIQTEPTGDLVGITMCGQVLGSSRSSMFDSDGLNLGEKRIVDGGKAAAYFGSNRYAQYLKEEPTGELGCIRVDAGSASSDEFAAEGLEVVSMSGLQVDFYSDYIGGEVRLAYYRDGCGNVTPLTGLSISGSLREVLSSLRLSGETVVFGSYSGPAKAILSNMKIY